MQTFPTARSYVGPNPEVAFLVDAGGFVKRVATLGEVRAFVTETDAINGTVRNVTVSKIEDNLVVATKTVRKDWRNL